MRVMGLLILCLFSLPIKAYVFTKTSTGDTIRWQSGVTNIPLRYYANSTNSFLNSNFLTIFNFSISEWNQSSPLRVINSGQATPSYSNGSNDVYFDNNSQIFSGTGVAAITEVVYEQSSGKIIEADIIINDKISISSTASSQQYLGNILTHEIGHLLGLGHSQVHRASMFYKLFKGQYSPEEDDFKGIHNLYSSSKIGTIKGRAIGSLKLIGLFGVHVNLISAKTGKVVSGVYTDESGNFEVSGLDLDDQYYLYLEPTKNIPVMPPHLKSVRADFCNSRARFRGNFYNSCFSSEEGYPVGIALDSTQHTRDVGDISISCDLKVSSDYFLRKGGDELEVELVGSKGDIGNALVGFFSKAELNQTEDMDSLSDHFRLDLSSENMSTPNSFLEIKILSQSLYSDVKVDLNIEYSDGEVETVTSGSNESNFLKTEDGTPSLEIIHRIPLIQGMDLRNNFKVSVRPSLINYNDWMGYSQEDFFPDWDNYGDDLNFYFMMINVVKKVGDDYEVISQKDYGILTDNKSCPDAPLSYSVPSNISRSLSNISARIKQEDQGPLPVACGSIGGPPSSKGPLTSLLVGLFLSVILFGKLPSLRIHR